MKNTQHSLTKKQKTFLISGAGLLGTAAIVTPIAVVFSQQQNQNQLPQVIDEFDAKYGITLNTYREMKDDFRRKYGLYLDDEWYTPEAKAAKMQELEEDLKFFDETFKASFSDESTNGDYSSLTKVLVDFARDEYGITLSRPSNVSYTDIYDYYKSLRLSSIIDMRAKGIGTTEVAKRIAESDANYIRITNDLQKRYPGDPLSAWTEASTKLYECFASTSEFAALVSAQDRLQEFLDSYNILFRTKTTDIGTATTYDSTLIKNLPLNEPISVPDMNNIFTFVQKSTNTEVRFTNTIIPNYTVIPVLHAKYTGDNNPDKVANGISAEASNFSDTYTLSIDWQVISNAFVENNPSILNTNKEARIVAHLRGNNTELAEGEVCEDPVDEINKCEIIYSNYDALASDLAKRNCLEKNFFAETMQKREVDQYSAQFIWPAESKDIHYEAFWDGVAQDTTKPFTIAKLDENALASAGLKIKVDKIDKDGLPHEGVETPLTELLSNRQEYWNTEDARLTSEQLFIKYCMVGGEATLDNHPTETKPGSGIFQVPVKIFAKYGNLENENFDDSCVSLSDSYQVINSEISDEFFTQSADNYNKTVDKYSLYFDEAVPKALIHEMGVYTFNTAVGITFDALAIVEMMINIASWGSTPKEKACSAVCLVLLGSHIAVIGAETAVLTGYFLVPTITFLDNLASFKANSQAYQDLKDKIYGSDATIFPRYDSDYLYAKDEYMSAKAAFNQRVVEDSFLTVKDESCDFYSNAIRYQLDPTSPVHDLIKNFNEAAYSYSVGPDDFIAVLSKFDEGEIAFDRLGEIEDIKSIIGILLGLFAPKASDEFADLSGKIKKINSWVKLVKGVVGLTLSHLKCSTYDRLISAWKE